MNWGKAPAHLIEREEFEREQAIASVSAPTAISVIVPDSLTTGTGDRSNPKNFKI